MNARSALATAALLTALAAPAWGQTAGPAKGSAQGAAAIPDFSGIWNHPAFPWFEPPASGPGPVTNRVRWPRVFGSLPEAGTLALPPINGGDGISDYDRLVGG